MFHCSVVQGVFVVIACAVDLASVVISACVRVQLLSAGVVHVILSAIETHRKSPSMVSACVRTLPLCDINDIIPAANELRSVQMLMAIAKRNARLPEFLTNILDLFMLWSAHTEMVELLLPLIVPFSIAMISKNSGERVMILMVIAAFVCEVMLMWCSVLLLVLLLLLLLLL